MYELHGILGRYRAFLTGFGVLLGDFATSIKFSAVRFYVSPTDSVSHRLAFGTLLRCSAR